MTLVFQPFTAQLGDETHVGEWARDGDIVHVRTPWGENQGPVGRLGKPLPTAERLLIDLLRAKGRL